MTALAVVAAVGCGSGNGDSAESTATTPSTPTAAGPGPSRADELQAVARAKRATAEVVRATRDRNLRGSKRYTGVCIRGDDPSAGPDVPLNGLKCHVNAYYRAFRGKPGGYIWGDAWIFRIDAHGRLRAPAADKGPDPLRNFLRQDDRRDCTGRHRPGECLPQSLGGVLPG
jgi:hypothetical protein